ncbi:MAG: PD40 domain-containing protein [Bacteroidetes bacterium]|nr:PD40 domain-containing protein [Bacteroidota bacterium]
MKARYFFILLFSLAFFQRSIAQDKAVSDPKIAEEKFKNKNYDEALQDYLDLLDDDSKNEEYNYRIGVCYLNTYINKAKAIPYLEVVTRLPKYDPNAMYLLGRAYHFAYRFDDALKCYNDFKKNGKGTEENLADADREIQNCYNAKELMKYPLNISFENLGSSVNSEYAEYYPFVPSDESFIVYTTKRSDGGNLLQPDGSYFSEVYISRESEGGFLKSKNIGAPVATADGNVEVVGMSANGNYLLLYYDNAQGSGDIFLSEYDKTKNVYKKPVRLDESINSTKGYEIAATISNDGSTIYFASDRAGGSGGIDLFVSNRLPNGKWGMPQNLGAEINTSADEDFPSLSPDGKTLYFSSKGHTSMGGYDIFKADWDDATKKFTGVKNLGYPINTPEDNSNFRISDNGRYGYVAMHREDALGDLDIYRVVFNDVEPNYSVVRGMIVFSDQNKKPGFSEVFITVTDKKTNEIIGNYVPNGNTGRYVMILAPGEYDVEIDAPGCAPYNETINIADKSSFKPEIDKDIGIKVQ